VCGGGTIAFVAALFFAVQPIHTEAVACIVGLLSKESAATFLLLVVAADYARGKLKPFSRYGWIAGLTAFYIALLWRP
jgi:hypothetical protein